MEKLPNLTHLYVIYSGKKFTEFFSKILDFDLSFSEPNHVLLDI